MLGDRTRKALAVEEFSTLPGTAFMSSYSSETADRPTLVVIAARDRTS